MSDRVRCEGPYQDPAVRGVLHMGKGSTNLPLSAAFGCDHWLMQLIEDPRGSGSTEEIALLYKNCVEARSLPAANFEDDDGRVAAPTKEQWDALPKAEASTKGAK